MATISSSEVPQSFAFVIPLKAKSTSSDWRLTSSLLERTLVSALRQTDHRFDVVIVGHNEPALSPNVRERATFVAAPHSPPPKDATRIQKNIDKLLKHALGLQYLAQTVAARYVMFLDSDDLVSSDLVANTFSFKPKFGFIMRVGYILDEASGFLWAVERFHNLCGSCVIFSLSSRELADTEKLDLSEICYSQERSSPIFGCRSFIDLHNRYEANAWKTGRQLDVSVTPEVIYRWNHGDHTNDRKAFRISISKKFRHFLPKSFSRGRRWQPAPLNQEIRARFGFDQSYPVQANG